ncbi:MAG: hypothetical protein SF123_22015 [Chloroflexota bacterium]|nr:hypothetical protein [Chloroflexota bacterium]
MSEQPEHNDALPEAENASPTEDGRAVADDGHDDQDGRSVARPYETPTTYIQSPIPTDLTLAQTIDRLVRRPAETWRVVGNALTPNPSPSRREEAEDAMNGVRTESESETGVRTAFMPSNNAQDNLTPQNTDSTMSPTPLQRRGDGGEVSLQSRRATLDVFFRGVGLLLAFIGTTTMAWSTVRTEATALYPGLFFAVIGLLVWVWVESRHQTPEGSAKYNVQGAGEIVPGSQLPVLSTENDEAKTENGGRRVQNASLRTRLIVFGVALFASAMAFEFSAGNRFTIPGVFAWGISILLWVWVFAPAGWAPLYPVRRWVSRLWGIGKMQTAPTIISADAEAARSFRLPITWVAITLLLIIIVATIFRVGDLSGVPPEMTSDHVEKLLDSWRVYTGASSNIFFQNNGGREVLQMYVMAMFARVSGLPFSFDTLKLLTAIEGIITIPVMFWLGRELFGRHDRRLGVLVGLALAGLVAVSYWHVSLSRLALRIVYTPLITALIFIYLARALRENSRIDFINAGLALGVGLYMYQAVRMIPVVIIVGVAITVIFYARTWLERRRYVFNFIALVVVAFAVFVPLFRFSLDYPDDFWRRSAGRIFGDALIETVDEQGNVVQRIPTNEERIAAVQQNVTVLGNNIVNALLMYTWRGDIAFINAAPNRASFDPMAGALLFVGLGGFTVYTLRRRDPALWLVLPAGLIMILPSALAIAQPIENPSATRMSGTLPFAYLLAAFGMATMIMSVRGLRGTLFAAAAFVAALLFGYAANTATYFGEFRQSYLLASKPYSDAGEMLRVFGTQDGGFANAFMIGYPHWWDHRAIGIEGGLMDWPNGIITRDMIPQFLSESSLRVDAYRFDPNRPILFMYAPEDVETELALQQWFPTGEVRLMRTYQPEDAYRTYYVPALGEAGFQTFVSAHVAG